MPDVGEALVAGLVKFGDRLRTAQMPVAVSDITDATRALLSLNEPTTEEVRVALRATLVRRYEDLARFDAVWGELLAGLGADDEQYLTGCPAEPFDGTAADERESHDVAVPGASAEERLGNAEPHVADAAAVRHAVEVATAVAVKAPRRMHRRLRRREDGILDLARTLRRTLATDGVPIVRVERGRPLRLRRWLILIDASGSMKAHVLDWLISSAALVRVLPEVETFAFGTRLTRLTPAFRDPRPVDAIRSALAAIPDFAGGTRIGDSLYAVNRRFASLSRGAVVLVVSDGCERGDPTRLATELALLRRRAHRLVWANPLAMASDFAPLTGGMIAAGPSIDHLIGCAEDLSVIDLAAANARVARSTGRVRHRPSTRAPQLQPGFGPGVR